MSQGPCVAASEAPLKATRPAKASATAAKETTSPRCSRRNVNGSGTINPLVHRYGDSDPRPDGLAVDKQQRAQQGEQRSHGSVQLFLRARPVWSADRRGEVFEI